MRFTDNRTPPLPASPLDPAAVYWLKIADCDGGWDGLTVIKTPQWTRLVRCDDPADAPIIAWHYKQDAHNSIGVYFGYTNQAGEFALA